MTAFPSRINKLGTLPSSSTRVRNSASTQRCTWVKRPANARRSSAFLLFNFPCASSASFLASRFPLRQRAEHQPPTEAQHVTGHLPQLDIGALDQLL